MRSRQCTTCGQLIYWKQNSEGKFVPFNKGDNRCHFETCTVPPGSSLSGKIKPGYYKPKISYKTAIQNKKLEDFVMA